MAPPPGYGEVGGGPPAAGRGRERGFTDAAGIAEAVDRINRRHAVVLIGAQTRVLHERPNERGRIIVDFQKPHDFNYWLANEQYMVDGEMAPIGPLWMISPERRQYQGVTFAPLNADGSGAPPGDYYNLWRGFSVEPKANPKKIERFLDHIRKNVASGNGDLCDWILGWFAHMIQRPTERIGTALVLRGEQGAGKTKPFEVIGSLIPQHYVLVDNPDHVTGKHNAHMRALLLLQADEAFWAGDKKAEGRLKSLVTSGEQMIEPKGVDAAFVPNYVRLGVTSNEDFVVPAAFEERRFCVVDVSSGSKQNTAYFEAIDKDMDSGGREALLHYLLHLDISALNLRRIPETKALLDQKLFSMRVEDSFWFETLKRGSLLPDEEEWRGEVDREKLWNAYVAYSEKLGARHKKSPAALGMRLTKLIPGLRSIRPTRTEGRDDPLENRTDYVTHRPRLYVLPDLNTCRGHFETMIRQEIDWGDDAK